MYVWILTGCHNSPVLHIWTWEEYMPIIPIALEILVCSHFPFISCALLHMQFCMLRVLYLYCRKTCVHTFRSMCWSFNSSQNHVYCKVKRVKCVQDQSAILLAGKAKKHRFTLTDHKPHKATETTFWCGCKGKSGSSWHILQCLQDGICQRKPDLQTHRVFHWKWFLFAINAPFIENDLSLPFRLGLFILPDHPFPFCNTLLQLQKKMIGK